ncbi:MAG: hypothetical protein ACSLFO_12135 [Acidimicrobiales bacterium]
MSPSPRQRSTPQDLAGGGGSIGRRTLLALFGGSALGLLVGCRAGPSDEERACASIQDAIPDVPAGLVAIGTRYRELHPDDDIHAVASGSSDGDPASILAQLIERVRADFDAGDVVDVDGWMLARTEARAAAVLAGC